MKQNHLLNIALGLALAFGSAVPTRAQDLLQHLDLNSDEFTKSDMTRAEIEAAIAAAGAGVVDLFGKRLNGLDLSGLDLRKAILKAAYINGTNFTDSNLDGAVLDRAWALKSNFTKATFKGAPEAAAAQSGGGPTGVCPQERNTVKAPGDFLSKTNPLPASAETVNAGKALFLQTAQPVACAMCHGKEGNGQGFMGAALVPPPRNFTCGKMMKDLPDGQLFWIIKNGSPGTGMMSFAGLPDEIGRAHV